MVRKAGREDLETLAQLAASLWNQHSAQAQKTNSQRGWQRPGGYFS